MNEYPTARQVIEFLLTVPLDSQVGAESSYGMDHGIEVYFPGGTSQGQNRVTLWDEMHGFDPEHRVTKKEPDET